MPGTFTFSKARRFTNAKELKKRNFNNFNISFNSTTTNLSHDREKYEERKKKKMSRRKKKKMGVGTFTFSKGSCSIRDAAPDNSLQDSDSRSDSERPRI